MHASSALRSYSLLELSSTVQRTETISDLACTASASGRRTPDTPDIWSEIWSNLECVIGVYDVTCPELLNLCMGCFSDFELQN
jgi:hypothetical protein